MNERFHELLDAAKQGNTATVLQLSEYLNDRDEDGGTVLMHAVIAGDVEAVSILLQAGADPNKRACGDASDYLASTPLSLAQQARNLMDYDKYNPIVNCLLRAGALDD
ncbi:MAG: ankyrin repeat domain-containing protein [Pseudomonadota bacterium]